MASRSVWGTELESEIHLWSASDLTFKTCNLATATSLEVFVPMVDLDVGRAEDFLFL